MSKRLSPQASKPNGVLIIDKPQGITSHDVVDRVRKVFKTRRVGHAGTLDPLATGVLVILVGKSTKLSPRLSAQEKEYLVGVEFGKRTDSADADGQVIYELLPSDRKLHLLSKERIEKALARLRGRIKQRVPAYSAVKVGGRKLYEQARCGKKVERPVREVGVKKLELKDFNPGGENSYPYAVLHAVVSRGTYTRSLVEDLDRLLGVPAHQAALKRLRSGKFKIEDAISLRRLEESGSPEDFLINKINNSEDN